MSYLGLKFLFNSLTASHKKLKPPSYYCKQEREREKLRLQAEAEKEYKKQRAEKRKELEKIRKQEIEKLKKNFLYDVEHLSLVSRPLTAETTLCMTDGEFTSRGLEIKAYVSYDNKDGEIFTIRVKIREDNTLENIAQNKKNKIEGIEFEYLGKVFNLTDREVNKLCNRKDYTELGNYYMAKKNEIERKLNSQL